MYQQVIDWIIQRSEGHGKSAELMRQAKASKPSWYKLLQGKGVRADNLLTWLENLGFKLVPPDEAIQDQAREICFVNAKAVRSGADGPPIIPEEYMAVPLVSKVGAGAGVVPEEVFKHWVLVSRNLHSVARRSNLIAVEVEKHSRSMVPLLHPGDIILVDLDDKGEISGFSAPGNIYLVREPGQEGGGMIKRVSISGQGQNTVIIYYSENAAENEPEAYFLYQDFDGHMGNAIVGKVVWAWTDLSRK